MSFSDDDNNSWAFKSSWGDNSWNYDTGFGSSSSSHWDTSWSSGSGGDEPGYGHSTHTPLNWGQRPFVNHGHAPHNFLSGSAWGWSAAEARLPRGNAQASLIWDNNSVWGKKESSPFAPDLWKQKPKKS